MNVTVKSLSLSYDQVRAILQDWINSNVLRTPHTVVDIDPWAYGAKDELQFNIALAPDLAGEPLVMPDPGGDQVVTAIAVPVNGTAHKNGGGVKAVKKEAAPEPSTASRKRRAISDDQRERVRELVVADTKRAAIAAAVGLSEGAVYEIIAELRASGRLPDRPQPAVA